VSTYQKQTTKLILNSLTLEKTHKLFTYKKIKAHYVSQHKILISKNSTKVR